MLIILIKLVNYKDFWSVGWCSNKVYQHSGLLNSLQDKWTIHPLAHIHHNRTTLLRNALATSYNYKKSDPKYFRCLICHWQPYFKFLKTLCYNSGQNSFYLFVKLQSRFGSTIWYRQHPGESIQSVPDLTTSAQANTTIIKKNLDVCRFTPAIFTLK